MNNVLRFGPCGCSSAFLGKFEGREIEVTSLGSETLARPKRFLLREIAIPERGQREALRKTRCHFFLDHHDHNGLQWVNLSLVQLFPTTYSNWQVHVGYWVAHSDQRHAPMLYRIWERRQLPTTDEILRAMTGLLELRRKAQLDRWLERMTPKGWRLPPLREIGCARVSPQV